MPNKIISALSAAAIAALSATPSVAQTGSSTGQSTAPPPAVEETRPATTTASGDTGLWFVPTGEVLPARKWSFSVYRVNTDYNEGFTDASNWPVTFGVGLGDRA